MTRFEPILAKGRYLVREAEGSADLEAARALRTRAFQLTEPDVDRYDETTRHFLIQDTQTGALCCCFRVGVLRCQADIEHSYCGSFHDLSDLVQKDGNLVELGRFCIDPDVQDPDILRIAWVALTDFVDSSDAHMLIGCSSFSGLDPDRYRDAFALLAERYLAPEDWRPVPRVQNVIRLGHSTDASPDRKQALLQMPTLLRSYLAIGGRVGDCAVIDPLFQTLHVFTGLQISAVPEARKARLRAMLT